MSEKYDFNLVTSADGRKTVEWWFKTTTVKAGDTICTFSKDMLLKLAERFDKTPRFDGYSGNIIRGLGRYDGSTILGDYSVFPEDEAPFARAESYIDFLKELDETLALTGKVAAGFAEALIDAAKKDWLEDAARDTNATLARRGVPASMNVRSELYRFEEGFGDMRDWADGIDEKIIQLGTAVTAVTGATIGDKRPKKKLTRKEARAQVLERVEYLYDVYEAGGAWECDSAIDQLIEAYAAFREVSQ